MNEPELKPFTYQNIVTLTNLRETVLQLNSYLVHVRNYLESELYSYTTKSVFNAVEGEFVIAQKLEDLTIKAGFFWELGDVYLGVRLFVPREKGEDVVAIRNVLSDYEWLHARKNEYVIIEHEIRLSDQLWVGSEPEEEWGRIFAYLTDTIDECKVIIGALRSIDNPV